MIPVGTHLMLLVCHRTTAILIVVKDKFTHVNLDLYQLFALNQNKGHAFY